MVSEKFITKQLNKLKKLDINDNVTNASLQYFYGLYDSIITEAYECNIHVNGIYKEYCDTYNNIQEQFTQALLAKMKKDVKICDKLLKSFNQL